METICDLTQMVSSKLHLKDRAKCHTWPGLGLVAGFIGVKIHAVGRIP